MAAKKAKKKKKPARTKPKAEKKAKAKKKPAKKKPAKKAKAKKPAKKAKAKKKPAKKAKAKKKPAKKTTVLFVPKAGDQTDDRPDYGPRVEGWTCAGRWPSRSHETRDRLDPPLNLRWRTQVARHGCRAAPVVSLDGVAYVPDTKGGLYALDGERGRQVEVLRTDPVLEGSPLWPLVADRRLPKDQVPISSAPAIAGWSLLFGDDEGIFYCVRRGDATVVWRKHIPQLSLGARAAAAYQAPAISQGVVFTVDHDGNLYAADVRSGRSVFSPRQLRGRPAAPPAVSGHRVLVATTPLFRGEAPALHAVGAHQGDRLWRRDLPAAPNALALGRELAIVSGAFGVRAVRLDRGEVAWSCSAEELEGAPCGVLALDRRRAYVALRDRIVGLDLHGRISWSRLTKIDAAVGGLACGGGTVWATAGRSLLAWDGEGGAPLGRTRLPGTAVGGPVLALGRLYVATTAGEVACFEGS